MDKREWVPTAVSWDIHVGEPSTHVLTPPKIRALREVVRDNILSLYCNRVLSRMKKTAGSKMSLTCFSYLLSPIVYQLRAENLTFVAPMPEQDGTLTMHFPEVSGGTYQKFSSPKLGELGQIDVFQYRMLSQWGKVTQN